MPPGYRTPPQQAGRHLWEGEIGKCYVDPPPRSVIRGDEVGPTLPATLPRHPTIGPAPRSSVTVREAEQPSELIILTPQEWATIVDYYDGIPGFVKDLYGDFKPYLNKYGWANARIKTTSAGNPLVVLSGYAGSRKYLNAPNYLKSNPKIADLAIGFKEAGRKAVGSAVAKGALRFSVITTVGSEVVQAVIEDRDVFSVEMGFTVSVALVKTGVATAMGALASAAAGAAVATLSAPVIIPVAAGIVVALVVGIALDAAFPSAPLGNALAEYYDDLVDRAMREGAGFLDRLEREIIWNFYPDVYHLLYR